MLFNLMQYRTMPFELIAKYMTPDEFAAKEAYLAQCWASSSACRAIASLTRDVSFGMVTVRVGNATIRYADSIFYTDGDHDVTINVSALYGSPKQKA